MSDLKKYYSWKLAIRSLLRDMPRAILGAFVFAELIRKKERTHYLVLPSQLGDSMLALSYLSEFKRQKKINHVTVVCTPNYENRLCRYYPNVVDNVICKEKWKIYALRKFISTLIGEYLSVLYLDRITFVLPTCNISMRVLWDNPSISFPMYAKAILYKISMASRPERPQVPAVDILGFISKYDLKIGHTVFFNPVANSVHCDVKKLLDNAATEMKAKGYQVITLTANDEELPVQGTQAIPCTLEEAFSLVEYGGTLIGVRSGFLDFIAYANCKLISILDAGNGLESFFRIEDIGVNPDCHTLIYDGDDEAALQKIFAIMRL